MGRVQDEEWFKQTVDELYQYRVIKKRIKVLEILLLKDVSPDAKLIGNYGMNIYGTKNPNETSQLEVELVEKQTKLEAIDASLELLDETEREIIELKFEQGYGNRIIYEVKLIMSSNTFRERYNEAITKIAQCLGYLKC